MTALTYWDSCCFLAYLQDEPEHAALCAQVLVEAEAGRVRIVTSALTVAEVLMLKPYPPLANDKRDKVEGFFKRECIVVRAVTRRIGESARALVWDFGISPKDAIHAATAIEAKVASLATFDKGLLTHSGRLGSPPLVIERPTVRQSSFDFPPPSEA